VAVIELLFDRSQFFLAKGIQTLHGTTAQCSSAAQAGVMEEIWLVPMKHVQGISQHCELRTRMNSRNCWHLCAANGAINSHASTVHNAASLKSAREQYSQRYYSRHGGW
jgi:hypothetical protein